MSTKSTILMYADDTVFISCREDYEMAMKMNQSLFDKYVDWTIENGLKINTMKTKHMLLSPSSKKIDLERSISIGDVKIKNTHLYTWIYL